MVFHRRRTTAKKLVNPAIITSNDRLSTSDDYVFDNAGNTTEDAHGRTFIYDAENKQVEVKDQYNNTIGEYRYDGDGRRVKKIVPSTGEVTVFVYSAGGQLVAEYSTVQPTTPKVSYTTADHLGSPRILTDENGATISRRDFHPFGEEIASADRISQLGYQADDVRQKFTSYERDSETELDFAQARMYHNKLGRFTSVDPIIITPYRLFTPQGLSLYNYTLNNPLKFLDPSGRELQFKNEDEAKSRREIIRNGLPKEQRGAVDYKVKEDGTVILTVDPEAAEKAGEESLLGRLNKAVISELVAVVEFLGHDEKFVVVEYGNTKETSFAKMGEEGSDEKTIVTQKGVTLFENTFDRQKRIYFQQLGLNSNIPNKSRILISKEQSTEDLTQAFYHETLAHFETGIKGDADGRLTGKNAVHPTVDADVGRIKAAVEANLRQK